MALLRDVRSATVVRAAALLALAGRSPGLLHPLGSDESGMTVVARAWDPEPDSLYGPYWVDRPPTLIAFIRLSDALGGPAFVRLLAALGCVVLVLTSAALARTALRYAGQTDERFVSRTGAWTAVLAASLTATGMIDPVMAKGEILGIPFVVLSFWCALLALCRPRVDASALFLAWTAGLTAVLAQGMKQNLVAGLVFGAVLLVGARISGRVTTASLLRLGIAALTGAAVPVVAVVAWTLAAGVRLQTLWYAVYGFRSDALEVIASGSLDAPLSRGIFLVLVALGTGMGLVLAGVALHVRGLWRLDATLTSATLAVVSVDTVALLLSGSFWRPYLFALVPGMVLCAALLLAVRTEVAARARWLVAVAAVVSFTTTAVWVVVDVVGLVPPPQSATADAIAASSRPGDTLVVYGGEAEIVLASGLSSPYPYLWSLPMRTLDPDLEDLRLVLEGSQAPTWFVMWVPAGAWDGNGEPLLPLLEDRYTSVGETCGGHEVFLREDLDRPPLRPDCDRTRLIDVE